MSTLKTYFLTFLVSIVLISCGDDDDPVIDETNLVGTWTYDRADAGDPISSGLIDAFLEGTSYTFSSDGTYEQTTTIFGEVSTEGTWAFANNMITLNVGDANLEEVWEVTELSANTLAYISTTVDSETQEETKATFIYKK